MSELPVISFNRRWSYVLDVPVPIGSDAKTAVGVVGGVAVPREPGDKGRLHGRNIELVSLDPSESTMSE